MHGLFQQGLHPLRLATHPRLVGMPGLELLTHLVRKDQFTSAGVRGDHLPGLQTALEHHVRGRVVVHADLGGQGDVPVLRDHVTGGAQAIAVHDTGGTPAVREHDTRRAVPRLHVHGVVLVEGPQVGVHRVDVLPGRRDQQAHRPEHVHAAGEEQFQHVVQRG